MFGALVTQLTQGARIDARIPGHVGHYWQPSSTRVAPEGPKPGHNHNAGAPGPVGALKRVRGTGNTQAAHSLSSAWSTIIAIKNHGE